MKTPAWFIIFQAIVLVSFAQKKPLDHSVYDGWQNIGEKAISSNGKYIAYTINPQEGDGVLVIQTADNSYTTKIERGYHLTITADSRFIICQIKPHFKDTREAKIKKKKPEEMPKDSLAIFETGTDSVLKFPAIKNYKTPEKTAGWIAFLSEKPVANSGKPGSAPDSAATINRLSHLADSLDRAADSLRDKAKEIKQKGIGILQQAKKDKRPAEEPIEEGTELILRNLASGEEKKIELVKEYAFSKKGNRLVVETSKRNADSLSIAYVFLVNLLNNRTDTILKRFHEAKSFAMDEEGRQLAFVAERDSAAKALRKFYRLYYYRDDMDSARMQVDRHTPGVNREMTVSENYNLHFSKDGRRLLFGLAPVRPVKDTTLPDFEKAGLDVWNYQDDELQPVQLKNLDKDLRKSYLATWSVNSDSVHQLGSAAFPDIEVTAEGNGNVFYAASDSGKRIAGQWQGFTFQDIYVVGAGTGSRKLVAANFKGNIYPSYTGKYLLLYDQKRKSYWMYNSTTALLYPVATDPKVAFYDEENDVPDDPGSYGIAGWEKDDKNVYVYDRYDIWKIDPEGKNKPAKIILPFGRQEKISCRYVKVEPEEKTIDPERPLYVRAFSEHSKSAVYLFKPSLHDASSTILTGNDSFLCTGLIKADSTKAFAYLAENYSSSPDIHVIANAAAESSMSTWPGGGKLQGLQLSHLNAQQANYLWGSAELFTWKSPSGKETEGIVYKPENFNPAQKYPMIVYFYERNDQTLLYYQAPSPTPSRLNIPFFVSRGYVVFVPDIWYTKGHPGKSAYDYIMSGTRALIRKGFIDSTKMGLQGQSWGGYQTAYLVTQTHLFAAAWAGAPVVNMFSAYGGIRWESGVNRQFQYEKTQSRIGATIWERPDLYTENSPLFHLPKITTPLVIMSNDADGAVPWYQGIEFFTAMRRLNKPVWLLSYNGEAHNLVERRNRKDIQVREQQFFDWLLKGEPPPRWITTGVPATLKGIDWGITP